MMLEDRWAWKSGGKVGEAEGLFLAVHFHNRLAELGMLLCDAMSIYSRLRGKESGCDISKHSSVICRLPEGGKRRKIGLHYSALLLITFVCRCVVPFVGTLLAVAVATHDTRLRLFFSVVLLHQQISMKVKLRNVRALDVGYCCLVTVVR